MHQSIKNAALLFNMLGFFSGIGAALLVLLFVGSRLTNEIQVIGISSLLLVFILPVLNFVLGWGFARKKYWAWVVGMAELVVIALYGIYQLIQFDIGGVAVLALAGPAIVILFDIKRVLNNGNA